MAKRKTAVPTAPKQKPVKKTKPTAERKLLVEASWLLTNLRDRDGVSQAKSADKVRVMAEWAARYSAFQKRVAGLA